jgi:hypothetical protein
VWLIRFFKDTKGASMVFVAVSIFVLIGFTGLAIDGGNLYLAKSKLQKAVDAGALAGANVMLLDHKTTGGFNTGAAEIEAEDIAAKNYNGPGISYGTSFPEDNIIEVTGHENVSLFLMQVLGISDPTISAVAQAELGTPEQIDAGEIIPVGIHLNQEMQFGVTWDIILGPGDGFKGNFGFLDFSTLIEGGKKGANGVGYYIENGSPVPISIGDPLTVKTGDEVKAQPIITAINNRIGQEIYVPIISEFGSGTSEEVTVLGFAKFILEGYNATTHTIQAKFVQVYEQGDMVGGTNTYGVYSVQLIK